MRFAPLFFVFSISLTLSFCSQQKDNVLQQAATIHNEASAIQAEIEPQIEAIDSLVAKLTDTKKTTTDVVAAAKIDSTVAALNAVSASFANWEDNLIEVPGMAHDHAEGAAHHHEHKPAPEMSSEQMLAVQKEIKANIVKIKTDLARVEAMLK